MNIGYCCINLSLNENLPKKDKVLVNRGMIKRTFLKKGLDYVSELALLNLKDTIKILQWNIDNDIKVYRLSSTSFPWFTEYDFENLPRFSKIQMLLKRIGTIVKSNELRVSYHPGPFNVLSSTRQDVVEKTIDELNKHAQLMDYMELDQSTYYPINIHIGNTKPSLEESANKFCDNFECLSESCKSRLTVENDDSVNQYSVKDLYEMVNKKIGIPIVFDQHHYLCGKQDQTMEESLTTALSTWKTKAVTHMSSSKKIEIEKSKKTAHADYIYEPIQTFGMDFDIEIEAKAKDLAVLKYREDYARN